MNYDVLAFSPHPDDVELGCSGTIINLADEGYKVGMVDMTNALLATGGDPLTRCEEAKAAQEIMGVTKRIQLDFKEGNLLTDHANLYRLVSVIRETRPHLVFAPYFEDRHPDHAASARLIKDACFWAGVSKFGDNQSPHRPHRLIYYFLHWEGPVSFVSDISSSFDRKLKAIRAYYSQFVALPGDRSLTYISRPEFLEKIINRARYLGSLIGSEYGEAFYVRETTRIENIMNWSNEQGIVG